MNLRRTLVLGLLSLSLSRIDRDAAAQGAAPTESSLRDAVALYVAAWNRHDVSAWESLLTEDIWYAEAIDYYQRMKGRSAVLAFYGDLVKTTDLKWEIQKIKLMPDGTATVVVKHHALILPKTGDKYSSTFVSDPTVTRWRNEAGKWRMYFYTSHKGSALDAMKKDGIE